MGRSSRCGRQKLILEIIALTVNHPSGSRIIIIIIIIQLCLAVARVRLRSTADSC